MEEDLIGKANVDDSSLPTAAQLIQPAADADAVRLPSPPATTSWTVAGDGSTLQAIVISGAGAMAHLGHAYTSADTVDDCAFHRADGFAGDFARLVTLVRHSHAIHITLNVVLPSRDETGCEFFPGTFFFHGTIPDNTVPDPKATDSNVSAAAALIPPGVRLHVIFIGVGMTGRNGKGMPSLLRSVSDRVDMVSVYDEREIDSKRLDYLRRRLGLCRATIHQHVGRLRDDLLLRTPPVATAPTALQLRTAYENCAWPATTDQVMLDLHSKLIKANGIIKVHGDDARQSKRPRRLTHKLRGEDWEKDWGG
jgi:hypothetical protein